MNKIKIQNKKGIQLNEAVGAVLTITIVTLLIIVAIVLFTNFNTSLDTDNTAAISTNESLAKPITGGITLAVGNNAKNGVCGAVTAINNGTTGNIVIQIANITQVGCKVYNTTENDFMSTTIRYTYPYTYSTETSSSNASTTMITQFSSYPALVGLVGTIIFLGLVIGVLVASFAFGSRGGA